MNSSQIDAASLTTFDVDPDGARVRIHLRDNSGSPASLVLPTACLNQLLMSLPRMVEAALRNGHGDDSLRVVHPLDRYKIELGESTADGTQQYILTLETGGGFAVSFVASAELLASFARSIFGDVLSYPVAQDHAPRVS